MSVVLISTVAILLLLSDLRRHAYYTIFAPPAPRLAARRISASQLGKASRISSAWVVDDEGLEPPTLTV